VNVGLPGTGLGTLLYIALALIMPIRYVYRAARGRALPGEGWLVLRQTGLAVGVVLAVGATGLVVGAIVLRLRGDTVARGPIGEVASRVSAASPVQFSAVAMTFLLLAGILVLIETLGYFTRRRTP
jgi:hypothetical protein